MCVSSLKRWVASLYFKTRCINMNHSSQARKVRLARRRSTIQLDVAAVSDQYYHGVYGRRFRNADSSCPFCAHAVETGKCHTITASTYVALVFHRGPAHYQCVDGAAAYTRTWWSYTASLPRSGT